MENIETVIHPGNTDASRILAPIWNKFSPAKLRGVHRAWILEVLSKGFGDTHCREDLKIEDLCSGVGADVMALYRAGYNPVANEFDEYYHRELIKNLAAKQIPLEVTMQSWLERRNPNERDVLSCLGNSICYLMTSDGQQQAISYFYETLKPGGILMIDERNFQRILDDRTTILSAHHQANGDDPESKRHEPPVLYGGGEYYPHPTAIEDNLVTMGIFAKGKEEPITNLFFYPFVRGELMHLLEEVFGDNNVTQFSNYRRQYDPLAAFYQYVCRK